MIDRSAIQRGASASAAGFAARADAKPLSASSMVEKLIPIWLRVLQIHSIGIDDNFFDVGGDSALALALFSEVAEKCGRELPPVMIYHAPTIAALAALLAQPTTPMVPAIVELKVGSADPPVFITHGLGGSVMDFFQVVKHIDTPRAILGMQARGIDGIEEPFDRIEDMARYSLESVRKLQPHGPYLLVGYSLGGLVTLEMARQLKAEGEEVALLAMLDSYPEIRYLSLLQRVRLAARLATRRAATAMKLTAGEAFTLVVRPSRRRSTSAERPYQSPSNGALSPAMQRVRDSAYLALTRYRPRFYTGKIKFVRAAIPTDFPANPVAVWTRLAEQIDVETVPGDHLGIMTTHFAELAEVLSAHVKAALG